MQGFDSYNLCMTGDIGRTLATPSGGLNEHIPIVIGCDLYNQTFTGDIACALTASMDVAGHSGPKVLILNDQGGDVMNVNEDITSTLRAQDHGHPPVVCMSFDVYNMQGNKRVFKTLNSVATDSDHIPVACISFQGKAGSEASLCVGKNVSPTLRPAIEADVVYSFEPGIMRRDRSEGNRAYKDVCSTLRAQMGDNQPAVCYENNEQYKVFEPMGYPEQTCCDS